MSEVSGNRASSGKSRLRPWIFFAAMFLFSFLLRLPLLLFPPAGFYYSMDELMVAFSAVDRFLGLPPTILMLPSTFLQFLFLPVFLVDTVIRGGLPLNTSAMLSELSVQLSQAYLDPHHVVCLMRWLVAILCTAGPVFAYCIVDSLGATKWAALLGAAFVLFNPVFVRHSVMSGADSVAITLVLASTLCLIKTKSGGKVQYAGFLLATAMACRITVAGFASIPLIFFLIDDRIGDAKERAKTIVRFLLGLILGFLLWCPYVWTDPIRTAKAVYGNVNRPESYFDFLAFRNATWYGMGAGFTLAWVLVFIAGCWVVFRNRHALGMAAVAGSVLISLPLILRSSSAMPRYFLPLLPCLVLLLGIVAGESHKTHSSWPGIRKGFIVTLAVLAPVMAVETLKGEWGSRGPSDLDDAVKVMQTLPKWDVLYVPEWFVRESRIRLPRAACERLHSKLQDVTGVLHFEAVRGIPPAAAEVLVTDFNEKDQALAAHFAITCRTAPEDPPNIFVYYTPSDFGVERTLADMDLAKALEQVRTSQNSAILVQGLHLPWATPLWSGKEDWYWYQGGKTHP